MTPWNSVFFPFEKRRFLPWAFFSGCGVRVRGGNQWPPMIKNEMILEIGPEINMLIMLIVIFDLTIIHGFCGCFISRYL